MTPSRNFLIVGLVWAVLAVLAGPAGRFGVVLALLLFGPGYLIESSWPLFANPSPFVRPTLWVGLSLSLIALLYEWVTFVGFNLSLPLLIILASACGLGISWKIWQIKPSANTEQNFLKTYGPWICFLIVFSLTLWTRFSQIRDLVVPPWVDPVHHGLLIRVAAEKGQVPYSLRPYIPVDSLPYHWGYHVFFATVMQLSGLELIPLMLWGGQILNALHTLTCAGLTTFFWRKPLSGLAAAIVVGLISLMPAYYLSWGRYTQLTGLLILPALAIAWQMGLRAPSWRWVGYTSLLLAGLSMVHALVLLLALTFLAAISLVWAFDQPWRTIWARMGYALDIVGLTLVLAGPWFWILLQTKLVPLAQNSQNLVSGGDYTALHEGLLWAGQNRLLVALALIAALWALFSRSKTTIIFLSWVSILILCANPWLIGLFAPIFGIFLFLWGFQQRQWLFCLGAIPFLFLNSKFITFPYSWMITNDVVVISFFIPLSVLLGKGAEQFKVWLENLAGKRGKNLIYSGYHLVLGGIALWGMSNLTEVINPVTVFVTSGDLAAITWIKENTPQTARFLINATAWYAEADRGNDGGFWLLPLTGRWTNTPPAIYAYGKPSVVEQIRQNSYEVAIFDKNQPQEFTDLLALIDRERITHLYLTQKGPLLPEMFAKNSRFAKVYEREGITILAVYPR